MWTRKGRLVDGKATCGTDRVSEETKAEEVRQKGEIKAGGAEAKPKKKQPNRRSVWCLIVGCLSGPVKKITQHFDTVHNLPPGSRASRTLRKHKCFAPQEDLHLPNPYARHCLGSSRSLTEYMTPNKSTALPEYVGSACGGELSESGWVQM